MYNVHRKKNKAAKRGGGGEWKKGDQRKRPHLHRRVMSDKRGRVLEG